MGPLNLHALDASLETLGTKGGETVLMRALEALQGERYLRLAEAQSSDPWTSRARPSFLYMMYALILWAIPMGLIAAADPRMAKGIADGMTAYLRGIPEELYALFGTGYLGYTAARTWGKVKGVER